eukprot:14745766-Alexandrium_andersonii.AAC.1
MSTSSCSTHGHSRALDDDPLHAFCKRAYDASVALDVAPVLVLCGLVHVVDDVRCWHGRAADGMG